MYEDGKNFEVLEGIFEAKRPRNNGRVSGKNNMKMGTQGKGF
jgi:hypothetical protein